MSEEELNSLKQKISELSKADIIEKPIYEKIYTQEDGFLVTSLEQILWERAKTLGILTAVKKLSKEFQNSLAPQQPKVRSSASTFQNITNFTPDRNGKSYPPMYCGSWFATDDGVFTMDMAQKGNVACYHPILPIRVLTNIQTGEERVTIAFKRHGTWRELTVQRSVIASARTITALANNGVAVTSESAKLLVRYLSDVENWNEDRIHIQSSTTKLGWNGALQFVPYDGDIVFDGEQLFQQLFESVKPKGSFERWLACAKQLRSDRNIIAMIAIAASFASVLIYPLGALPFIVDFFGETGGGKTVTLMLAASVWADPDVGGGFITNLKSTSVNLEARSDMLNNLPVLLDDTSHADKRIMDNFESTVYDLCSGLGKGRSNKQLGTERQRSWKNVVISNGEKPLSSYVSQGGAINRLLEFECNQDIFHHPKALANLFKQNYGHAGKMFVECIKTMPFQTIKDMCQEFEEALTTEQGMQKQIAAMAAILTADKIATDHIFKDGMNLVPDDVKNYLTMRDEVSDNIRCYGYVCDMIQANDNRFGGEAQVEQWGYIEKIGTDEVAYFYPFKFEELLKKENFSRKAFTFWAKKNDLLIWSAQEGKKNVDTVVKRISNVKTQRYIALRIGLDPEEIERYHGFTTIDGEPIFN